MNKKDLKKFIVTMIILIILFLITFIIYNITKVEKVNVKDTIKNGGNIIIFIDNSDSTKCKICSDLRNTLNDNKVSFYDYDLSVEKDYNEILESIDLNSSSLNAPSILIIEDGKVDDGIMNITDKSILKEFINKKELGD